MTTESAPIAPAPWLRAAAGAERVRRAIRWPWRTTDQDLVVRGRAEHKDQSGRFAWRFGSQGRFRREGDGVLEQTVGFDGAQTWIQDVAGRVRALAWGEIGASRIPSLVLSGDWLREDSGLEIRADEGQAPVPGAPTLRLRLGGEEATLALDGATLEPRRLELSPSYGPRTWSFEGFTLRDGLSYPACVEQVLRGGRAVRYVIEDVVRVPAAAASLYAAPAGADASFATAAPAEVPVERSALGFLMVRPRIDGRDVGSFIFDTGAGTNVITPKAAAALGMSRIGTGWLGLAAGSASGDAKRARSVQLGPLTIDGAVFIEMDLEAISAANGMEVAGIIGYDVLMRAVVEIEVATPRIALHDPSSDAVDALGIAGDRARWEPIVLYGNHVYIPGRLEGRDGMFRLDTGAPQVPLVLNAPTVERLHLLEGRETTRATIGVPGGTMEVAMGNVEHLELAGRRFERLPAIFPLENGAAFNDIHSMGNVGQECMRPFRAVFDYRRLRAAFVERTASD